MTWQTVLVSVLYVIGLWWFSTGTLLALYSCSRRIIRWGFVLVTGLAGAAFVGLLLTRTATNTLDVYLAVTCGVVLWGWQVASHYLGFITGPHTPPTETAQAPTLLSRFRAVLRFSLYHELVALGMGVLIGVLTLPYANAWGFWIYMALWAMHTSARLNIFLGVRNFRIDLLPSRMHPLRDLLGKQSNNGLFPVSVVLASAAVLVLFYHGTVASQTEGYVLVATMIALGLLEHWLMMLPLPANIWGLGLHHVPLTVEPGQSEKAPKGRLP